MTSPSGVGGGVSPQAVHGLVGADREVALLLDIIAATSSGPGVEPMAAAVARMITAATASDVCFVHVLDDTDKSMTLAGATPPFDEQVGRVRLPLGSGVSGWVASHRETRATSASCISRATWAMQSGSRARRCPWRQAPNWPFR